MCGRYALTTPADVLAELYEVATGAVEGVPEGASLEARYNVAPTQPAPIVRTRRGGERALCVYRWGLVPSWAKDPEVGNRMINARCETAADRPAFRTALRWRRCLVPADGFYEWQRVARAKQPYFIHRADGLPLTFAGLYERWRPGPDEPWLRSFTILTTDANARVGELHDRMPVIIGPEHFDLWLDRSVEDPSVLASLLRPAPDDLLDVYPVSRRVNSPAHEGPDLIERVELSAAGDDGEPDEGQLRLF